MKEKLKESEKALAKMNTAKKIIADQAEIANAYNGSAAMLLPGEFFKCFIQKYLFVIKY